MKRLGLRAQILLLLLAPLAAFAPATVVVIHQSLSHELSREIDARALATAEQLASIVVEDVLTGETYTAETKLADVRERQHDIVYVFVTDARGEVVAHTFQGGFPVDLLGVERTAHDAESPVRVALGDQSVHDLSAPILGGLAGRVHVGVAVRGLQVFSLQVLGRLTLIGLGVVAVGVALTLALSNRMVRRLQRVTDAATSIGAGALETRVPERESDEIGRLGAAFNRMAERLKTAREERETTMQALGNSEKLVAVGRLAAGVAHEISNPLAGVAHCLDNLLLDDSDSDSRQSYYRLMRDGVDRANRVVGGLLNYARQHELEVGSVDLLLLVERVASLLKSGFGKSHVEFACRTLGEVPLAEVDPHLTEQVVMNLLLNAAEAMPDGGPIDVEISATSETERPMCKIRVMDSGTGIPAESLSRIFDPFYTTKGTSKGSGLGLSVSLGIVERHGGKIEVHARPDGGTIFDVYLPQHGARPHEQKRPDDLGTEAMK